MSSVVLDCSVAISWLMPDKFCNTQLLDQVATKGAIVPSHWILEVGNVLLIAERHKRISTEQRQKALYALGELPITLDPIVSNHAWSETLVISERYGLNLYDASHLELALRLSLPLATFDPALKRAAELAGITVI